jgi:hypothetical protein
MGPQNIDQSKEELDNTNKPLLYNEIYVGMKVIDQDGDTGSISRIDDIYNVFIKYDNDGSGFSCLNGCCSDVLYENVPKPSLVKCTCSCHYQSGITHVAACCDNGYIKSIF